MKSSEFVRISIFAFLAFCFSFATLAQTLRNVAQEQIHSPHISFTTGGFLPIGDLNDRYGAFAIVGANFGVKTENNGYWGFRATALTGADCQEPGLLTNLLTEDGEIIDNEGDVARISVRGRGGIFGIHGGKIFNDILSSPSSNPNSGLFVRGGIGSIHHKIRFDFTENRITQLDEPYVHGYDRLSWGVYASSFVGYWHMDNKRRINYYAGITSFAAHTFPMRTTNLDTGIPDVGPRLDAGLGLEFGWVLHIYKRAPKEYWY